MDSTPPYLAGGFHLLLRRGYGRAFRHGVGWAGIIYALLITFSDSLACWQNLALFGVANPAGMAVG